MGAAGAGIMALLDAYTGTNVNVAEKICDRYARVPERIALFYEDESGRAERVTFRELQEQSAAFAGFLRAIGVGKGDRVAGLLPKGPELLVTVLAVWRLGAVYVPLFTAFGPDAVAYRVRGSRAKVLVAGAEQRGKVPADLVADGLMVVTVAGPRGRGIERGDFSFHHELARATPVPSPEPLSGDDLMILLYTSGTTGNPKAVVVPVKALAAFEAYMRFGLDLRDEDAFWNVADPGWAYGLYYGLIGPLLLGKATLWYNGRFDPKVALRLLEDYRVTNWAAAPTAFRALRAAGATGGDRYSLRVISSAGEPLNPEVMDWARREFGVPIHDHYGQTELGMVINNHHHPDWARELKPGSMGLSMPGFRAAIVDDEGRELGPGQEGHLAIDVTQSPLFWFRGYEGNPEATRSRFTPDGRYYLTGDDASMDEDGYFYFSGRSDDIILSAGYRIGPFEVENVLLTHPAVAECAVVGAPDELRGEIIQAFVVLRPGYAPSPELEDELRQLVRSRLAAHAYPRAFVFVRELPKTPSGKIQRYLLRKAGSSRDGRQ